MLVRGLSSVSLRLLRKPELYCSQVASPRTLSLVAVKLKDRVPGHKASACDGDICKKLVLEEGEAVFALPLKAPSCLPLPVRLPTRRDVKQTRDTGASSALQTNPWYITFPPIYPVEKEQGHKGQRAMIPTGVENDDEATRLIEVTKKANPST